MAFGTAVVLVAAFVLASGVSAQTCQVVDGVCRVKSSYIASLKGSSNAIDQ